MAEALPVLRAAFEALQKLERKYIMEFKSFANPPAQTVNVLGGVLILFGQKSLDWKTAMTVLGNTNFLDMLTNYDRDNIPDATLNKLKKFVTEKNMIV